MSEEIQHLEIITDSAGIPEAVLPQTDAGIYVVKESIIQGTKIVSENPSLLPEGLSWLGRKLFKHEAKTLSEKVEEEQDDYVRRNSNITRGKGEGRVLFDQPMREYPGEGRSEGFIVDTSVGLHLLPVGAPKALKKQEEHIKHVRTWRFSRADFILKEESKHTAYVPLFKKLGRIGITE